MKTSTHRWQRLGTPPAGRIVAACNQTAARACRRCDLAVCAEAATCGKCGPHFHLVCTPRPQRMGPPEKPADLRYPRRAATQRMVVEVQNLIESQRPCHKCRETVFEGDNYCRHCGSDLPRHIQPVIFPRQ